jgi:hypothetical protein
MREPVDLLAVFVDGRFQGSVFPSVLRPDVAAHTGNPEAVISGFCAEPVTPPEPGQRIQVIAISGHRCAELPTLDFSTQT